MTKEDLKQISDLMDTKFEVMEKKFDDKFDAMEKRFDDKFDAMEKKFDGKFDAMEKKFDGKFDTMEKKVDGKLENIDAKFTSELKAINHRIESRFDKTDKEIAELRKICLRLDKGQEEMSKDIKVLKTAQLVTEKRITGVQDTIANLDDKVDNLKFDFGIMREEFTAVKSWISEHA